MYISDMFLNWRYEHHSAEQILYWKTMLKEIGSNLELFWIKFQNNFSINWCMSWKNIFGFF